MKHYYERRAPEFDDWYLGTGMYATLDRPGWHEDVAALQRVVGELHLQDRERAVFLAEASRVARELVVGDAARREGIPETGWQERALSDGSRHRVFKRYFTGEGLVRELGGGGQVLHEGPWFVVVRA